MPSEVKKSKRRNPNENRKQEWLAIISPVAKPKLAQTPHIGQICNKSVSKKLDVRLDHMLCYDIFGHYIFKFLWSFQSMNFSRVWIAWICQKDGYRPTFLFVQWRIKGGNLNKLPLRKSNKEDDISEGNSGSFWSLPQSNVYLLLGWRDLPKKLFFKQTSTFLFNNCQRWLNFRIYWSTCQKNVSKSHENLIVSNFAWWIENTYWYF